MMEIIKKGFLTLPVSIKRHHLERFGVPAGGPADRFLCILANRLVGNTDDACALDNHRDELAPSPAVNRLTPRFAVCITIRLAQG